MFTISMLGFDTWIPTEKLRALEFRDNILPRQIVVCANVADHIVADLVLRLNLGVKLLDLPGGIFLLAVPQHFLGRHLLAVRREL